jgi:RND family efflux transporter MFP subunit
MPLLALAIASPLAVAGCEKANATVAAKEEPAVEVHTEKVTAVDTPRRLRLTGTLRGAKETDLAANVAGRIVKTDVERGQTVEQGDLLARVDVKAAQLALAEARVSVETSKTQQEINAAECARYEKLRESGVVTDLQYDQVAARCKTAPLHLEAARARQSMAAKNVGDGMIRSPFSGVVTERYVEVGEYVQPASRVVSLAQVDALRLVFSVPERNYPDVKQDAEVLLRVAAYGERTFAGKVAHISGAVRATRDIVVEARVDNPDHELLPGMFADIELTVGSEKLPSVPSTAVFERAGKPNVFVLQGGRLEQRVLSVAPEVKGRIPVRKGVSLGEQVVTKPGAELENGQRAR